MIMRCMVIIILINVVIRCIYMYIQKQRENSGKNTELTIARTQGYCHKYTFTNIRAKERVRDF